MTVGQGCQLLILPACVAEGGDPGPVQLAPHLLLSLQEEREHLQSWLDILAKDLNVKNAYAYVGGCKIFFS